MKDNRKLIGRKMKGFRFEDNDHLSYAYPYMEKYEGEIGIIKSVAENHVEVEFGDAHEKDEWPYPLDQAREHLV